MIVFSLYVLIFIVGLWLLIKQGGNKFFTSRKNTSWILSGLSLFMLSLSVDQGQLITGIVATNGFSGLWILWIGWISAFVIPLVFAPYWRKLNFMTDNQFLLFRFHGKSGKALHLFRALYVGGLVVALSICFHLVGFSRFLSVCFNISTELAIVLTGIILILYTLKNMFDVKLKLDAFHAAIYFISFIVILVSLWRSSDGFEGVSSYFTTHPEKLRLFPAHENTSSWFSFFIIIGVQWWSCNLFDGGGPEMSRFTAVENSRSATLTGLLPLFISFILGNLLLLTVLLVLGSTNNSTISELTYTEQVVKATPEYLVPLIVAGMFGVFISTAESLLLWGSSFLTIDVYQTYIKPKAPSTEQKWITFCTMIFLIILSTLFALLVDNLYTLILFTFSIAAGVAPVYILRWTWYRINAWSQLSAMLSSAFFTLIYPFFHETSPLKAFPMEESRILIVTILTTATWLLVTFVTPNTSSEVSEKMSSLIGSPRQHYRKIGLALLLGVFMILIVAFITWCFLFYVSR